MALEQRLFKFIVDKLDGIFLVMLGFSILYYGQRGAGVTTVIPYGMVGLWFVGLSLVIGGILFFSSSNFKWRLFCVLSITPYVVASGIYLFKRDSVQAFIILSYIWLRMAIDQYLREAIDL